LCIYIRSAFIHFDLWPVLFAFLSDTSSFPRPKFWFGSSVASVSKAAEYKKQVIRGTRNNNLWGKRYLAQDATNDLSRLDVLCCGILYQRDCRVHGSSLKKVSRCRFGGSLYIILSRSTGILNDGDIHRSIRHDYRDWTYIDDIHYLSSLLFFMFFIFIWSGFPWWPGHSPARINKKRRRGKGGGCWAASSHLRGRRRNLTKSTTYSNRLLGRSRQKNKPNKKVLLPRLSCSVGMTRVYSTYKNCAHVIHILEDLELSNVYRPWFFRFVFLPSELWQDRWNA
jgi:hypothetical protein